MGNCLRACIDGSEDWVMCFVRLSHPLLHFSFLECPTVRGLSE